MKKIQRIVLSSMCMIGFNAMAVQIKNNLVFAVAKKDPSSGKLSKVVNICSGDVASCNFGVITVDDVVIPRDQLTVPLYSAYGVINARETKEVGPGEIKKELGPIPVIYVTAYYTIAPGVRYPATFMTFATKPVLTFPEDFTLVQQQ